MLKLAYCLLLAGTVAAGAATAEQTPSGTETYDLIFRNGTLDEIPKDATLSYDRAVSIPGDTEAAEHATGEIELSFGGETDTPATARLRFLQDGKHRNLGAFPASVGNPIIMYFVETTVRDMAEVAGGSPFYIRNRVKDSLVQFAEIETGTASFDGAEIATQEITLRPFLKDPNRDRMGGFADLALTVRMSDAVPGWYHSLTAEAPNPQGGDPVYSSTMTVQPMEGAE